MTRILVLVGLPGSGKSTFSTKLIQCRQDWKRVNQDEMKSRKACQMHMKKFLKDKYNVVVDRCNFDVDQRKTWLDLGKEFDVPVDCIVLTTTQEECSQRVIQRENHPTDVAGPKGVGILKKFVQNYQPPTHDTNEGFDKLLYVDPSEEPECTEERINIILDLLEKTPSLLIEPTVTSE